MLGENLLKKIPEEKQLSILEKLTKTYHIYQEIGSEGYAVSFHNELNEEILEEYKFLKGAYSILSITNHDKKEFITFNYDSKEQNKNS